MTSLEFKKKKEKPPVILWLLINLVSSVDNFIFFVSSNLIGLLQVERIDKQIKRIQVEI